MSAAPNARSLFAAAREDGPDAASRDAVFRKIGLATGIATGAAAAATALSSAPAALASSAAVGAEAATSAATAATSVKAAATGTALGLKLLALGAALGALTTALGVVLAVTVVAPETPRTQGRSANVASTNGGPAVVAAGVRNGEPAVRRRDPVQEAASVNAKAKADARANADAKANADANASANAEADAKKEASATSDLAEEARLVTAARNALMAGDPARALSLVQATRRLGARSLEPEELGLEARALRAMGRADDAAATELVLKRRYPDHALAR